MSSNKVGLVEDSISPLLLVASLIASTAFILEIALFSNLSADIAASMDFSSMFYSFYSAGVVVGIFFYFIAGVKIDVRRLLQCGLLFYGIGAFLIPLFELDFWVVSVRFIQGLGGGLFSPAIPIIFAAAGKSKAAKYLILWGATVGLCATVTPLLLFYLAENVTLQTVSDVVTALAVVGLACSLFAPYCAFRSIGPPIPTTCAHLYRGMRPVLTCCPKA